MKLTLIIIFGHIKRITDIIIIIIMYEWKPLGREYSTTLIGVRIDDKLNWK